MRARARDPKTPTWREQHSVLVATPGPKQPGGKAPVTLHWTRHPSAVGYNLYRVEPDAASDAIRLNGRAPIRAATKCEEFCAFVPRDSDLWNQLCDGLNALTGARAKIVADEQGCARFDDEILAARLGERALHPFTRRRIIDLLPGALDPCVALARGLTEDEAALFDTMAHVNLQMRRARGLAFIDETAEPNKRYAYSLRAVDERGQELVLASNVVVIAGRLLRPDPPSGITLSAKDHKVLLLWNRNPYAHDYVVERSQAPGGPFVRVHDSPIQYDITQDLDGASIPAHAGYLDFRRWDPDGLPTSHDVNGTAVYGPANGTTYYYRVAALNIHGLRGGWSSLHAATPARTVPPCAPRELTVIPVPGVGGLRLDWRKVTHDVEGHVIPDATQTYEIFRAETADALADLSALAGYQVGVVAANPLDATMSLHWTDTDPALVPPYGEKDFCYRLRCVDTDGNRGAPSAAITGRVPDTRPPGPTHVHDAEGFEKYIRVRWDLNHEPDVAGYQVYRGVCDHGELGRGEKERRCQLVLVANISAAEARQRKDSTGFAYADDPTVPAGSPICYAYWVRAYDAAQNLYDGHNGCPASPSEYACARLVEKTAPPAPVLTRLAARERAVELEWVASPVQDQRAFHIYRSETEDGPLTLAGCVLLDGTVHPGPWTGAVPSCGEIPAQAPNALVRGQFIDKGLEPDRIYWYRVSALDWLANESGADDLHALPAISTFTFAAARPTAPIIIAPPASPASGCGLRLQWQPSYQAHVIAGFVVFRRAAGGSFRQVSGVIKGNTFEDPSALRGIQYDYRVQSMDHRGRLSEPSASFTHSF